MIGFEEIMVLTIDFKRKKITGGGDMCVKIRHNFRYISMSCLNVIIC